MCFTEATTIHTGQEREPDLMNDTLAQASATAVQHLHCKA